MNQMKDRVFWQEDAIDSTSRQNLVVIAQADFEVRSGALSLPSAQFEAEANQFAYAMTSGSPPFANPGYRLDLDLILAHRC